MNPKDLQDKLEEMNVRIFGLEGRMATFESVNEVQSAARKELLETILENQDRAEKRLRQVELKMAFAAGAVVLTQFLVKMLLK